MDDRKTEVSILGLVAAVLFTVACASLHGQRTPEAVQGAAEVGGQAVEEAPAPEKSGRSLCEERLASDGERFGDLLGDAADLVVNAPGKRECRPVGPDGRLSPDTRERLLDLFRETEDLQRLCFETRCHIVDLARDGKSVEIRVYQWKGHIQPWEENDSGVELLQADDGEYYVLAKRFYLMGRAKGQKDFGGFVALEFSCIPGGREFPWGHDALAVNDGALFAQDFQVTSEKVSLAK